MEGHILIILAGIGVISLICQWVAWQMRLPAILFLLLAGIVAGPMAGWIQPDELYKDLLFPLVSLSVAVILFEGALTLEFSEIKGHGVMVRNLLSIGMLVNFAVGTLAARYALDLSWQISLLFGSIVVVTGPTVIMPMLRAVRPKENLANILKWEGIIIDPIGALLAVLVYEVIISGYNNPFGSTLQTLAFTLFIGVAFGCASGYLLGLAIRRHWLPQFLQNAGSLAFMLGVYALSNVLAHESGLLTVTVMGVWMANMRGVSVEGILEFKESLSVLLISALFIILAARLDFASFNDLGWGTVWVLIAVLFIARPLGIWLSAIPTKMTWQEKAFLSWISPRGIVAAAVSSLFAFRLEAKGFDEAVLLVPLVFIVVIATVVLQSLTALPIARKLKVTEPATDGYLIIGANKVALRIAKALINKGISVKVADTNWENVKAARMDNIPVYYGNPVSEHAENHMGLAGIGNMLAISPYKEMNTVSTFHFLDLFGSGHVYGLSYGSDETAANRHKTSERIKATQGLFGEATTYSKLASLISRDAVCKTTTLSDEFTFEKYKEQNGNRLIPLFAIPPNGRPIPFTPHKTQKPASGWEIIGLITPMALESPSVNAQEEGKDPDPGDATIQHS